MLEPILKKNEKGCRRGGASVSGGLKNRWLGGMKMIGWDVGSGFMEGGDEGSGMFNQMPPCSSEGCQ